MITVELSRKDKEDIAAIVVERLSNSKYNKAQRKEEKELIGVREAAEICGITTYHIRKIKDRLPHVKVGDHQQGRLMFYRDSLLEHYLNG